MIWYYVAATAGLLAQAYIVVDTWIVSRRIKRRSKDVEAMSRDVQRVAAKLRADALELMARQAAFEFMCQQNGVEIVRVEHGETKH